MYLKKKSPKKNFEGRNKNLKRSSNFVEHYLEKWQKFYNEGCKKMLHMTTDYGTKEAVLVQNKFVHNLQTKQKINIVMHYELN